MPGKNKRVSGPHRRQQIIRVVIDLFARQGFEGTTTRDIAARAQVNEAIIFRHFHRKENLYWAVIESQCRDSGRKREAEDQLAPQVSDREFFSTIAEGILRRNTEYTGLGRLLLYTALENHRLSERFFRTYVAEYYEAVAEHIRQRIHAGCFRNVNPLLAARGFIGMVVYHFLIQELFGGKRCQEFDPKQVSTSLTGIWLEGMLARNGRRLRSGSPAQAN